MKLALKSLSLAAIVWAVSRKTARGQQVPVPQRANQIPGAGHGHDQSLCADGRPHGLRVGLAAGQYDEPHRGNSQCA
jgi:hypothetical protein